MRLVTWCSTSTTIMLPAMSSKHAPLFTFHQHTGGSRNNICTMRCCLNCYSLKCHLRCMCVCAQCGSGIITLSTGSVSRDACRVPAGWGIRSYYPLVAQPCTNNSYGIAQDRPVSSSVRCVSCPPNMHTADVLSGAVLPEGAGYTGETSCKVAAG